MSKEENYNDLIELRNRIAESDVLYEEDTQLLDRVLDDLEKFAELKAENEKLKQLKFLEDTNCTFDEFKKMLIKDEEISNERALKEINIDNEILRKQLKERDEEIEKLNKMIATLPAHDEELTHQVCEKIRESVGYFTFTRNFYEKHFQQDKFDEVLDQIEKQFDNNK